MRFVVSRSVSYLALALITSVTALVTAAPADAACRTFKHRAKIESDPFGTDLAYLNISIRVCYNGKRITKPGTLDITPSYTNNALGSMEFQGVSPEPIAEYRYWQGRKRGSYYVKAGGNFVQSGLGLSHTDYIWASMRIYGNGHVDKDRQNG